MFEMAKFTIYYLLIRRWGRTFKHFWKRQRTFP